MDADLRKKLFKIGIPSAFATIFCVILPIFIPDLAIYYGFGPKATIIVYGIFSLVVLFLATLLTNNFNTDDETRAVIECAFMGAIVALFIGFITYDARYSKIPTKISSVEINGKTVLLDPPRVVEYIIRDSDLEQAAIEQNSKK